MDDEKEKRIIEFLEKNNIYMTSPEEKKYEYFEKNKKNINLDLTKLKNKIMHNIPEEK